MADNADYNNAVDVLMTISVLKEACSVTEVEFLAKKLDIQR